MNVQAIDLTEWNNVQTFRHQQQNINATALYRAALTELFESQEVDARFMLTLADFLNENVPCELTPLPEKEESGLGENTKTYVRAGRSSQMGLLLLCIKLYIDPDVTKDDVETYLRDIKSSPVYWLSEICQGMYPNSFKAGHLFALKLGLRHPFITNITFRGPLMWYFLHMFCAALDKAQWAQDEVIGKIILNLYRAEWQTCTRCIQHFTEVTAKNKDLFTTPGRFLEDSWKVHNIVNSDLQKAAYPKEAMNHFAQLANKMQPLFNKAI